ncbi:MAG: ABC transporter permease [Actinobacteria bacterium]|nr:MAG: ABC transporter permease [Actinomycetota bacterium]
MLTYVLRRLLYSIPVLVVSSFLIFAFVATTTDPLETVKMQPNVNPTSIALVERQNHLNQPVIVRYGYWVRDAFTNSFGRTILGDRPILPDLVSRFWVTMQLIIAAQILSLLVAVVVGVYSAIRQYSLFDYASTTLTFLGLAVPVFWLGLILQIVFTTIFVKWHVRIFYTSGLNSVAPGHGFHFFLDRIQHLVLPVITLTTITIATFSRFMRDSMLEVVNADYVRTARAKGLMERRVIIRHALRNALIPLVTLASLSFGTFFGGTVITETIYGLPGMGRYFIDALNGGETYVIMAWLMVTSALIVLFNLVGDILLGVLDPKIRLD